MTTTTIQFPPQVEVGNGFKWDSKTLLAIFAVALVVIAIIAFSAGRVTAGGTNSATLSQKSNDVLSPGQIIRLPITPDFEAIADGVRDKLRQPSN